VNLLQPSVSQDPSEIIIISRLVSIDQTFDRYPFCLLCFW